MAKYNERFYQRSRRLPQESQASLCLHYLAGLNSELRTLCCMDRDNKRWDSLHALVTFTLAEEERLNMKASSAPHVSKAPCPSRFPSSKPQWQQQRSAAGQKRGAAAVMAAA